jgi:hypothetical protein
MILKDSISKYTTSKLEERFFWLIKISLDTLWMALARIKNGQVEIIETKKKKLFDKEGIEGLIEKARQARDSISSEREILPEEIFLGVPESWLEEGEPKKPHLSALKQLTSKLGLTLAGFVGTHRAVLSDLAIRESNSPNIILLEITKHKLDLLISKLGQVTANKEHDIKDSLAQGLEETLKEVFTGESLPPRILVFGEEVGENEKGEILAHPWNETGLFLHLPKVEILPYDLILKVVALAFKESPPSTKAFQRNSGEELTREELGFVIGKDIAEESREIPKKERKPVPEEKLPPQQSSFRTPYLFFVSQFRRIQELVRSYHFSALRFRTPILTNLARPAFLGGGLLVLVLLIILGLYWYLPRAEVIIFIEPKVFEDSLMILVATHFPEEKETKAIIGTTVEVEVSGVKSLTASGKKMVGDYAKGRVIVFNKTLAEKTFLGGTQLLGPNDLRFTLSGPVTVDAATISTASGSETKTYGQANSEVTAVNIGSGYNLPSDTDFSFTEYSRALYSVLSSEDFSGGSSREITVVSADDLEKLEASLSAELKEKAKEDLMALAAEDKKLLPEAIELDVKNKEFSQKVGEETDRVTLTMNTLAQTLSYPKTALGEILVEHVAQALPAELDLLVGGIETEEKFVERRQDSIVLEVYFQASLAPKFDYKKIKTDLMGKSPSVAKEYLDKLPNVVGSQVYIWPPLPRRVLTLPHSAGRIKVQVEKK